MENISAKAPQLKRGDSPRSNYRSCSVGQDFKGHGQRSAGQGGFERLALRGKPLVALVQFVFPVAINDCGIALKTIGLCMCWQVQVPSGPTRWCRTSR